MQLRELYLFGKETMNRECFDNPGLEASLLLLHSRAIEQQSDIYSHPEEVIHENTIAQYQTLLKRRLNNEPLAYITGGKDFFSRTFNVSNQVLIPRPETEHIIEETIQIASDMNKPVILDVGTGSGCIAVTLAHECSDAFIYACDISNTALAVARENAQLHKVNETISFIRSDLITVFKSGLFDIIVSNPPYIKEPDIPGLEPNVRDYEPRIALCGGVDGLFHIRKIISDAARTLRDNGWCLLEIGEGQAGGVKNIFENQGFENISITRDLAGIDRVIKG